MFRGKEIERRLAAIERKLEEQTILASLVEQLLKREERLLDRLMSRSLPEYATYGQRDEIVDTTPKMPSMDELIGTIGDPDNAPIQQSS